MKIEYIVSDSDINLTYKQILSKKLYISSRLLSYLKNNNLITFIPSILSINQLSKPSTKIIIEIRDRKSNIIPVEGNFEIIYEDNYFLFVNKTGGITSHPSKGHWTTSISNYIEHYLNLQGCSCHLINRLDKETSGTLCVAKNTYIHSIASQIMQESGFTKKYIAAVKGKLPKKYGFIEEPIELSEEKIKRKVSLTGKYAKTFFNVLFQTDDISILLLTIFTGKTHQIRVHLSHIGNPIIGDTLYGHDYSHEHMLLHAIYTEFEFKLNNKKYCIYANPPAYFNQYLNMLQFSIREYLN